jgi:hypothetical protein
MINELMMVAIIVDNDRPSNINVRNNGNSDTINGNFQYPLALGVPRSILINFNDFNRGSDSNTIGVIGVRHNNDPLP